MAVSAFPVVIALLIAKWELMFGGMLSEVRILFAHLAWVAGSAPLFVHVVF